MKSNVDAIRAVDVGVELKMVKVGGKCVSYLHPTLSICLQLYLFFRCILIHDVQSAFRSTEGLIFAGKKIGTGSGAVETENPIHVLHRHQVAAAGRRVSRLLENSVMIRR